KKNADIHELMRGKTGRVYGNLMSVLTIMKGLPLAYNKDLQEIKEQLFDGIDHVKAMLTLLPGMLEATIVNKDVMYAACGTGFLNATDCADYLTNKGMAFRDAYQVSDRKSTRLNSSHVSISYAVFCLKKKKYKQ